MMMASTTQRSNSTKQTIINRHTSTRQQIVIIWLYKCNWQYSSYKQHVPQLNTYVFMAFILHISAVDMPSEIMVEAYKLC